MFGRIIHIGCARKRVIAVHVCNTVSVIDWNSGHLNRAEIVRIG